MKWLPFSKVPNCDGYLIAYREDRGVFPIEGIFNEHGELFWFLFRGYPLQGSELPSHYMLMPTSPKTLKTKEIEFSPEKSSLPSEIDSPELQEAWLEYCKVRREIKKKLTPTAVKLLFKRMTKWGAEKSIIALNQASSSGWQGVFEPKGQFNGRENVSGYTSTNHREAKQHQYHDNTLSDEEVRRISDDVFDNSRNKLG